MARQDDHHRWVGGAGAWARRRGARPGAAVLLLAAALLTGCGGEDTGAAAPPLTADPVPAAPVAAADPGDWFTPASTRHFLVDDGAENRTDVTIELGALDRLDRLPRIAGVDLTCTLPDGRIDARVDAAAPLRVVLTNRDPAHPLDLTIALQKGVRLKSDDHLVFAKFDAGSLDCTSTDYQPRGLNPTYRSLSDSARIDGYVILRRYFTASAPDRSGPLVGAVSFTASGINAIYRPTDVASGDRQLGFDLTLEPA